VCRLLVGAAHICPMNPIRLINLGRSPAALTQSIYHALAERMDEDAQDTIILCRPDKPYLCLGYHQVFESVFDPVECERRKLPVLRRRIGGGATYLDENQVFYQYVFHHTRVPVMLKDIFSYTLSAPVKTLQRLGIHAELRDTNEIEVGGRRIAGTGGGRMEEAVVVVGNVLLDFDYEAMASVWRVPSEPFRLLAEKALHHRVVTLNELTLNVSADEVHDLLAEMYTESMKRDVLPGELTDDEWLDAHEMAKELASREYLSLHKTGEIVEPMRSLKISTRAFICYDEVSVGEYEVQGSFWVSGEVIQFAILHSSPEKDWIAVEQSLRGVVFKDWKSNLT
jgi:lipoate---protein ligase